MSTPAPIQLEVSYLISQAAAGPLPLDRFCKLRELIQTEAAASQTEPTPPPQQAQHTLSLRADPWACATDDNPLG